MTDNASCFIHGPYTNGGCDQCEAGLMMHFVEKNIRMSQQIALAWIALGATVEMDPDQDVLPTDHLLANAIRERIAKNG